MPTWEVRVGDCRTLMAEMPDNSIDAVCCDPPYELGFMGKSWDSSGIAYDVEVWRQALRVLKPGGHLLAFSGSRTYHRMAVAIEDAGFEIRDQIMWIYGSGFPKSHDVSKGIDKAAGAVREVVGTKAVGIKNGAANGSQSYGLTASEVDITAPATPEAAQWQGFGTALKPAHEPIVLARRPLVGTVAANVLAHGTGALNIDGCRVGAYDGLDRSRPTRSANQILGGGKGTNLTASDHNDLGRWPANIIHDGSWEVESQFNGAAKFFYSAKTSSDDRDEGLWDTDDKASSASEFRPNHTEKAAMGEDGNPYGRWQPRKNNHPTVKPTDLMRYLCRLITPPGGTVLDPFTGSGGTGKGAVKEGFNFIGCELSEEYAQIARARIAHALAFRHQSKPSKPPKMSDSDAYLF